MFFNCFNFFFAWVHRLHLEIFIHYKTNKILNTLQTFFMALPVSQFMILT